MWTSLYVLTIIAFYTSFFKFLPRLTDKNIMFDGYVGVRTFLLLLFIVLLIWSIVWPIKKLNHSPSAFWVISLGFLILITGFFEAKWLYSQNEGTQLTQQISKNPEGHMVCQRFSAAFMDAQMGTLGYVAYSEGNQSNVKFLQCQQWDNFLESDKNNLDNQELIAVGVVIHEAYHVGGEFNEATAQCLTMKNYSSVLTQYGVRKTKAEEYADTYRELSKNMPTQYLNGTC